MLKNQVVTASRASQIHLVYVQRIEQPSRMHNTCCIGLGIYPPLPVKLEMRSKTVVVRAGSYKGWP